MPTGERGALETLGRYRIVRKLGEGGMGVVYAAHDERLDRPVAIKRIRPGLGDGQERERLWREARAAASVNHPNVCQLYEIDEDGDGLFLAMELLDGAATERAPCRGPLLPSEAVQIALAVLSALAALHRKGIIHRDLKPSNIFLAPHGVKLLDFGLARPFAGAVGLNESDLTLPGVLMGTPRYMAPELIEGSVADARSDLFVLGIVLYEMLAGKPPFRGESVFEVARAIMQDEPPALGGSPGIVGLDRIIHRALRKPVDERYQTAEAFAQDLRASLLVADSGEVARVRPMTRLVVLPFRMLRPDPSIDFLAFSLADAISSALSGLPSLVVRSTAAASRFAADTPDIPALAGALDVDVVLLGTLLSSGEQVRVSAQLVQAPSGTLVRAMTSQSTSGEIFQLQDALAKSIVESLSLSLTAGERGQINRDAPANPEAYECYLRANQIQLDSTAMGCRTRSLFALSRARSAVCACVGATGTMLSTAWEVRRPVSGSGQSRPRRGCAQARSRNQSRPVAGPQPVRTPRSRRRTCPRGDGPAAGASAPLAIRARALRGPGAGLPLLRSAGRVGGRVRARSAPGSRSDHQRLADLHAEGRLGAGDGNRSHRPAGRHGNGTRPARSSQ